MADGDSKPSPQNSSQVHKCLTSTAVTANTNISFCTKAKCSQILVVTKTLFINAHTQQEMDIELICYFHFFCTQSPEKLND